MTKRQTSRKSPRRSKKTDWNKYLPWIVVGGAVIIILFFVFSPVGQFYLARFNTLQAEPTVQQVPQPFCGNKECDIELGENSKNCERDCCRAADDRYYLEQGESVIVDENVITLEDVSSDPSSCFVLLIMGTEATIQDIADDTREEPITLRAELSAKAIECFGATEKEDRSACVQVT